MTSQNNNSSGNIVLGLDLEGMNRDLAFSGVDEKTDRVIEIGAVLWDWSFSSPVAMLSELIDEADRLPISEEVEMITGINDHMLEKWGAKGQDIRHILNKLRILMEKADYIMAHNGEQYDIPMLKAMFIRHGLEFPNKTWIDTSCDIEYPPKMTGRSMALLEHSHGFINPFPHRATTDVLSMLKIASQYSLTRMVKIATSPKVTLIAQLKAPNWKDQMAVAEFNKVKNKVAKARFRWNPSSKEWAKIIPKVFLDEGKVDYDFEFILRE